ncbi:MAG: BrnA antitoxin family protein [Rubrivivax sp.]
MPNKELISSLRIDQDVIEWFKAQGPGCQTRINSVLRAFRDASAGLTCRATRPTAICLCR